MKLPFRIATLAVASLSLLAACNEDGSADVREEARQSVISAENGVVAATAELTSELPAAPTGPVTTMNFAEKTFDFGTVTEGEKVVHTFNFTNDGDEPLILSNAKGSCGCTVPSWPREPIAPGATGEVTVEFNSRGKQGARDQKVTLTANTNPAQTVLSLKGDVDPSAAEAPLVQ